MSSTKKPHVLVVDDEETGALLDDLRHLGVDAVFRPPEQIETPELCAADLVLLDLDLGWDIAEPDLVPLRPPDGLALAAILRRQRCLSEASASPTAMALLTGKIDQLVAPFPPQRRRHLAARHYNLEWVFWKADENRATAIASLAKAIHSIPADWARGIRSVENVVGALGIEGAADVNECWASVESCHAPLYEFTQWSHGVAFVRWMLHQILPHPCFLWDSFRVAARLRIEHRYFEQIMGRSESLRQRLAPREYLGMLSDFAGSRWWRHRIEAFAWEITDGDPQNPSALRTALSTIINEDIVPSTVPDPIVCLGDSYLPLEETYSIEQAVRIQLDDWPAYADSAWMPIELIRGHSHLRSLVVQEDRDRLEAYAVE